MFEFKGNLSKECEDFLYNKQRRLELISLGSVSAVFSVAIIVLAIFVHYVLLIGLILFALIVLSPLLPSVKKSFLQNMPNRIVFDFDNDTIFYSSEKREDSYAISLVKELRDYGNFYHIIFSDVPDSYYVLQKDLIVKGSIEEFENCFNGKIRVMKK